MAEITRSRSSTTSPTCRSSRSPSSSRTLEDKWGVKAAPVAVAVARRPAAAAPAAAAEEQTEFTVDPHGRRRQQDQRHQGGPRDHQPRPQGGQGPGRGRAQDRQGRRLQGRRRGDEEEARRGRRQGRDQVTIAASRHAELGIAPDDGGRRCDRRLPRVLAFLLVSACLRSFACGCSRSSLRELSCAAQCELEEHRWRRSIQNNFRVRKNFARSRRIIDIPNLIDIQKRATTSSCRRTSRRASARTSACRACSRASSRSRTSRRRASLEFVSYNLEKPKYDVDECRQRGMTFAAPIKVVDPPGRLGHQRGDRRAVDPRRQGAGGLLRRDPADDRERHVHHQRHRARRRQPAAPLARACSSTTTRARRHSSASCSTARASSRTAARGSTSSSTPRTSSTCASTAAASCTRRCCCARSATRPRSCSTTTTTPRPSTSRRARSTRSRSSTTCSPASARRATSSTRTQRGPRQEEPQVHQAPRSRSCKEPSIDTPADRARRAGRQGRGARRHRRDDRRGPPRSATRSSPRPSSTSCASAASTQFKVLFIDNLNVGPYLRDTLHRRQAPDARGGDHGDLPAPAPGRSADARDGAEPVQQPVLQPRALRPVARSAASS